MSQPAPVGERWAMASPRPKVIPMPHVEGSPYPKCGFVFRAAARAFDALVALGLYTLGAGAGPVMALLFLLLADGLLDGQSAGKRLFGVKVIHLPTRTAARYRESVLRNAPFGLVVLLGMLPTPLGYVAFLGGALVIGGVEAWKVYRDPLGMRLGDVWAQTQVIDGKVVVGGQALAATPDAARAGGRVMYAARGRAKAKSRSRLRRDSKCASR